MRRILIFLICTGLLCGCAKGSTAAKPLPRPQGFTQKQAEANTHATALVKFLKLYFVQDNGIKTGLHRDDRQSTTASGSEYLSESSGLWLLHLVNTKQYAAFRQFYAHTKTTFYNGKTFSYRYDPAKKKRYSVNASADDLRIMRALIAYDEATASTHYRSELRRVYKAWANVCLPKNRLRDLYDNRSHTASTQGSLAFFDLQTLRYLGGKKVYAQAYRVVNGGYLGAALPVYAKSYDWYGQSYSDKDLNTSEALEVLLQLARIGKLRAASRTWLISAVQRQYLANAFSTSGVIVDAGQSVGNWALIAQIFATIHDAKHYDQTMRLIWKQQLTHGRLAGGFGDTKTQTSFSYNNLNVLLAEEAQALAHQTD